MGFRLEYHSTFKRFDLKAMTAHQLLQQHVTRFLESDAPLSEDQSSALRRLISKDSLNFRMALSKAEQGVNRETLDRYLQEVIDFYLGIETFQPCRESDYKNWLRKMHTGAETLAAELTTSPSIDLYVPPPLVNAAALIQVGLENLSGEMGTKLYEEEISPTLKRILQQMPVTVLLNAISQVADQELKSPPIHYWEQECDIKASRKHGDRNQIFREQILLRGIKKITISFFDTPNQELVADLTNTLLNVEKFDEENVRKLP